MPVTIKTYPPTISTTSLSAQFIDFEADTGTTITADTTIIINDKFTFIINPI